ncbi:MAG: hypothetical protein E2598_06290 [Sphingobium sp.]|nr:hypothetical protein [Sphingobium sp.]
MTIRNHPPLPECLRGEIERRAAGWADQANRRTGDDFNIIIGRAATDLKTWFMLAGALTQGLALRQGRPLTIPTVIATALPRDEDLLWLEPESQDDWHRLNQTVEQTYQKLRDRTDQDTDEFRLIARRIINIKFWLYCQTKWRSHLYPSSEIQEAKAA